MERRIILNNNTMESNLVNNDFKHPNNEKQNSLASGIRIGFWRIIPILIWMKWFGLRQKKTVIGSGLKQQTENYKKVYNYQFFNLPLCKTKKTNYQSDGF